MEAQSAAFKFGGFRISTFRFNEAGKSKSVLRLDFNPSGKFISAKRVYELTLEVRGIDEGEQDKEIVYLKCFASFEFGSNLTLQEVPGYFYKNAIAIVFPYIRAFISTLTLQANSGVLLLGLLNLSSLEVPLIKNTTEE